MSLLEAMISTKLQVSLVALAALACSSALRAQSSNPDPGATVSASTSKSNEIRGDSTLPSTVSPDADTGTDPDAAHTVYSKFGGNENKGTNPYGVGPQRGRVTYGKKKEQIVVTESTKPAAIRKNEFGADVTEPTGVFKKSLLDTGIDVAPLPSAQPKASASPRTRAVSQEQKTTAPAPTGPATATEPLTAPQLQLSVATSATAAESPAPGASVAPASAGTVQPSPAATP